MERADSFKLEQALAKVPKEQREALDAVLQQAQSALTEATIAISEIEALLDVVAIREDAGL